MKLKTFAILLSLSAAYSSTTHAMDPDQDDRMAALLRQRQDSLKRVEEIPAEQEKWRQDSKRTMEEIKEADRKRTAETGRLTDEIMHAMWSGTMSLEEGERRLSELEEKFKHL